MALHLNKLETALPKNTLCQLSLVEIGTVVLGKMVKSLQIHVQRQTVDR